MGDSRAVLYTADGRAIQLTTDHKPDDEAEYARIKKAGGEVDYGGVIAPGGGNFLKCARSLGDAQYKAGPREKHLICAEPELIRREVRHLACTERLSTLAALWRCSARLPRCGPAHMASLALLTCSLWLALSVVVVTARSSSRRTSSW